LSAAKVFEVAARKTFSYDMKAGTILLVTKPVFLVEYRGSS
jgi:hypothetical protein